MPKLNTANQRWRSSLEGGDILDWRVSRYWCLTTGCGQWNRSSILGEISVRRCLGQEARPSYPQIPDVHHGSSVMSSMQWWTTLWKYQVIISWCGHKWDAMYYLGDQYCSLCTAGKDSQRCSTSDLRMIQSASDDGVQTSSPVKFARLPLSATGNAMYLLWNGASSSVGLHLTLQLCSGSACLRTMTCWILAKDLIQLRKKWHMNNPAWQG